mgnify:FL=1
MNGITLPIKFSFSTKFLQLTQLLHGFHEAAEPQLKSSLLRSCYFRTLADNATLTPAIHVSYELLLVLSLS